MYKIVEHIYEDDNFNIDLTYEEDPNGGELVFAHNQWFEDPTPTSIRKVRKELQKLKKRLKKEGHSVLFANTVNFHFIEMMNEPFDIVPVEDDKEGLIAWPLQH